MKIKLFSIALLTIILASCAAGEAIEDNTLEILPDNIKKTDLSEHELPVYIYTEKIKDENGVPINMDITHEEGDLDWDIRLGKTFNIIIEDWGDEKKDPVGEIKYMKDLEQFYDYKFIQESEDHVVYSKAIPGDSLNTTYHFYLQKELRDNYFYTVKNNAMEKYTLDQVNIMLEAARSIKPIDEAKTV